MVKKATKTEVSIEVDYFVCNFCDREFRGSERYINKVMDLHKKKVHNNDIVYDKKIFIHEKKSKKPVANTDLALKGVNTIKYCGETYNIE